MLNTIEDVRCEASMYKQVFEIKWLRLAATEGMTEEDVLNVANTIMFETREK